MAPGAPKVGLIGYGYWGTKLARCFHKLGALVAICDTKFQDLAKIAEASKDLPDLVPVFGNSADMFTWSLLDRVAIATPPETHYALAKEALERGLGVFVEKPLATSLQHAKELESLAKEKGLPLMVGHTYLHCPGIQMMENPVGQADLYIKLLNPEGPPSPTGENILWAALPHALSLALHFFPYWPLDKGFDIEGATETFTYLGRRSPHRIQARLFYWDGSQVFIDVGNHTRVKARAVELRVGNTRYCYENSTPHILTVCCGVERKEQTWSNRSIDLLTERREPLELELVAFLKAQGVDPLGARVVELMNWLEPRLVSEPERS